jgi:cytochrome c-type biogenesis protein CcmH/NrfF
MTALWLIPTIIIGIGLYIGFITLLRNESERRQGLRQPAEHWWQL